jgi:hypothetical protein
MAKVTKKPESDAVKRLRAMERIAGPDDPIYSSGLTMNSIREARPTAVAIAQAEKNPITAKAMMLIKTLVGDLCLLEVMPDGKGSQSARDLEAQIAVAKSSAPRTEEEFRVWFAAING